MEDRMQSLHVSLLYDLPDIIRKTDTNLNWNEMNRTWEKRRNDDGKMSSPKSLDFLVNPEMNNTNKFSKLTYPEYTVYNCCYKALRSWYL